MVNTAIITNTASYPGTGSCNKVDADEFSGCIVGGCIVGDCIVGVDSGTSCGVVDTGVFVGAGVGDANVRIGVTMFTVVASLYPSPSSASTVYPPVKAAEVLNLALNLPFSSDANVVTRSIGSFALIIDVMTRKDSKYWLLKKDMKAEKA